MTTIQSFDTAYPGSMVARKDGQYIDRLDTTSLAGALLEAIQTRDRKIEDLEYTVQVLRGEIAHWKGQHDDLLLKALAT